MVHTGRRILIVDDDPAIRATLSLLSTTMGYRVRSAEDGLSALRQIRQEEPDLLLSDLYMPGMSGFELLSIVRRQFPAIHTIAMSSAFSGVEVPTTVKANAFYEKASNMGVLIQLLSASPDISRPAPQPFPAHRPSPFQHNYSASSILPEKSEGSHQDGTGIRERSGFTLAR